MLQAPVNETKAETGQSKKPLEPLPERERYPLSVETPEQQLPVENGSGSTLQSGAAQYRSYVGNLQRLYGNQAVLQMHGGPRAQLRPLTPLRPSQSGLLLQRKCDCGAKTSSLSGICEECSKKRLQAKLAIGASNDPLEQEADRVADQVLAAPAPPTLSGEPLHIQRLTGQPTVQADTAPASVDRVLASPGRPLDPALRQNMEQRFGHDFSGVRVHSGTDAQQSARDVNALAYTVGNNIVFGAGRFAPGAHEGRRLLAHELMHVVQQSGSDRVPFRQDTENSQFTVSSLQSRYLQRQSGDPLEEISDVENGFVKSIVIDPGSRRTRFYTAGGKTINGTVVSLASSFKQGDYLLERATSNDPKRTWNIFNTDGSIYPGGLEFEVELDGVDFDSLRYTSKIQLKVASGLLPKLIDIEARIKAIKDEVSKTLVNDAEELAILKMFEDVPPEQAADFVKRLREEKVGDVPLLERLDRDIDSENNIALHQHLSRLKLQAGGTKSAAALADALTLAWHDVMGFFEQKAVFSVTPSSNGKYRIRYLGGISSGLYSAPEYSEIKSMGRRDRLNIMTGQGIEIDADQPIIVHDYDNDRQIVLTAEDLIAYQHAGVRKFLQDVGSVAALATPAGAETVGARVLAYGVQIAAVATLIVDENKLNIRKWFPNWGPAIIDVSEKIKIAIAVVGVAQLVQGGWKLFANLRRLRAARAAMDAKAIVSSAEEMVLADKQAAQLEANADKLLNQADLARRELGLADEAVEAAQKIESGAKPTLPEASAAVMPPARKTQIINSAIGKGDFSGEFASLANRELSDAAQNTSRLRPARVPGYSVEVPIEGTDHFLARNAGGTWCLFSSSPKGCGAITIAKTVDELFEEISRELGTTKAAKIGTKARIDIASAVADAKQAGFIGAAGEPVGVDLVVQPHSAASETRAALGVSGKDVQSAHHAPSSVVKNVSGYSREGALTVLLPRATHKTFDDFWKQWSIAERKAGRTKATVEKFVSIVDQAIQQTPNIDDKTKGAMSWVLQNEFYKDLGLDPSDLIDLPFPNIKPD